MDFNGSVTVCTTGWGCGDVSKDGKYVKACKKNFNIPTKYVLLRFSSATPCMFVRSVYLVMAAS